MSKIGVLDHGYVEFVEGWGSDERIIEAARMSTGKGFLGWGPMPCSHCGEEPRETPMCGWAPGDPEPGPITYGCKDKGSGGQHLFKPGDEKLLRFLWENEHRTPFEMAGLTIEVQAPIFVFREWHRHRTQSYNEMSSRYTEMPELFYVPSNERMAAARQSASNKQGSTYWPDGMPLDKVCEFQGEIGAASQLAFLTYRKLLSQGVAREVARLVLPVNTYSRMRASVNLRNWLSFLTLRMASAAQYEIRVYANAVHKILSEQFPRTLALFDEGRKT